MQQFIFGSLVMACLIVGTFFLRFWRKSKDRLFVFFAGTFWLLGLNWLALAFTKKEEPETVLYVIRLIAFVLLIVGILDKNRARGGERLMRSDETK
jgi:hypothetical protein